MRECICQANVLSCFTKIVLFATFGVKNIENSAIWRNSCYNSFGI